MRNRFDGKALHTVTVAKHQISANRGPDSTFVDEASSTRSIPKPSSGRLIKVIDRTRLTQA